MTHCKPLAMVHYGRMPVAKVEHGHILAFQYGLRDMPTVACFTYVKVECSD